MIVQLRDAECCRLPYISVRVFEQPSGGIDGGFNEFSNMDIGYRA